MSGRDEEPIKDFPSCEHCKRDKNRFVYWIYNSSEGREKNIYFNRKIGSRIYAALPVPVYDDEIARMCTLKELAAIGDKPIVCNKCRKDASLITKAKIIRIARRMIIKYEGKLK